MSLVARIFFIIAFTVAASVDFFPYCASIAPLIGESSFSIESVFFENAAWRLSTAAL